MGQKHEEWHREYERWHAEKKRLNEKQKPNYFQEREIWWCALGANVGFEMDGKGDRFTRPVVILKKFSARTCLVVPLTTRKKGGRYYLSLGEATGKEAQAVLSQLRLIDHHRLTRKVGTLEQELFEALKKAVVHTIEH